MPGIAERFAGEHFTLNSISERRQEQVLAALRRFEAFLDDNEVQARPLEQATEDDLRAWLVHLLKEDGLAPSTVAWYLKMVMPFYRWCWQHRLIDADALLRMRDVSPPRGAVQSKPRPYKPSELKALWDALDKRYPRTTDVRIKRFLKGTSPLRTSRSGGMRWHVMRVQLDAIVELALVCGLRRREIFLLSLRDVHPDNKYLAVQGKRVDQNPKPRDVPYADTTREAVRDWLRFRKALAPSHDALWLSVTGPDPAAPLTLQRLATVLSDLGGFELHRLRHTCATERLRAGMKLEKLQQFLGHATHQQTLAYAQLVRGDVYEDSERTEQEFQRRIKWRRAA